MLWKVCLLALVIAIVHIIFNPKAITIVGIAITRIKKKERSKEILQNMKQRRLRAIT